MNEATIRDVFPSPLIDQILERQGNCLIFSEWWRFQKLDKLASVFCLPAKEQELYRNRLSHHGQNIPGSIAVHVRPMTPYPNRQNYDDIVSDLRFRFSVQEEFSARDRWYALKCQGEDSGSFLS